MFPYFLIVGVLLLLFAANILPVLLLPEEVKITENTLVALFALGMQLICILQGCLLKHKGNAFLWRTRHAAFRLSSPDREETFTPAYERQFRALLLVHCAAVPFYIPLLFLTHGNGMLILPLLLLLLPAAITVANEMRKTYVAFKAEKEKDAALERERIEQQRREEEGRWK